jgi:2'-5' RNA ligase
VRLFVALEIPVQVREGLAALISEFRGLAPKLKWVRPENLHLTLKFIGETESTKLDSFRSVLANVSLSRPVELQIQGLGFFPNERWPRVFWAGLRASDNLASLAADIDAACASIGLQRERRPFSPHLTLARLESTLPPGALLNAIQQNTAREFGAFRLAEFRLIESKLKPAGAEYTTVQSFPFVSETT